jgi:general secretion pathway protein D
MRWIKFLFVLIFVLNAKEIELNFKNLDINDFIKMVAKITDKNILLTKNLHGKVNFISVKPINEKEVYNILLNILRSKGYTLIEDKGFLKVVRSAEVYRNAPPLAENNKLNQVETDIIHVENIPAKSAFTQINFLLSRYGKIVVNNEKNLLIITDYPSNLELIKKILKKIDTKNKNYAKFYDLKFTDVNKIFNDIKNIMNTLYPTKIYNYKLIKNIYANEIIAVAPKKVLNDLGKVINKFDKKSNSANMSTDIITLKNSDVNSMIKVLQQIIRDKYKVSKEKPSITADKETNSLIILATKEQLQIIKKIIKALDVPKQQVYVKAKILEISNLKASKIGNEFGLLGGIADSSGLYTLSANLGGSALAFDPSTLGLSLPSIKQGLALGITVNLLETLGAAKKLSEPSILCINNTPSTIYIGKTISILTGKTTSTSTSESYTRQDIGLTLKVTPRIDSDNKVSLNVESTIEDLLPGSQTTLPITSKREIKTTAIVRNGQSIILGGLVRDNDDLTTKKVPLLGDIPILGNLFKSKAANKDKTTIVILLTPYIVNKSEDLDKLRSTLAKLNELEAKFIKKIIKKHKKKKIKKQVRQFKFDISDDGDENDR